MFQQATIGFALDVLEAKHKLEMKAYEGTSQEDVREATQADFDAF